MQDESKQPSKETESSQTHIAQTETIDASPQVAIPSNTGAKKGCKVIYFNSDGNPIKPDEENRKGCCPFKNKEDIKEDEAVFHMPLFVHAGILPLIAAALTWAGSIDTPLCRSITVTASLNDSTISTLSNIFSPLANFFLGSVGMINSIRIIAAVLIATIKNFRDKKTDAEKRCETIASLIELLVAAGLSSICCLAFGYLSQATATPEMNQSYTDILHRLGPYENASDFDQSIARYCANRYPPNGHDTPSWELGYYLNFAAYGLVFLKASLKIARSGNRTFRRLLTEWVSDSGLNHESVKALAFIAHASLAVIYAIPKYSSTPSTDLNSPFHYFRWEYLIYGFFHTVFERILKSMRSPSAEQHGFLPDVALTLLSICAFSAFVPITNIAMQQVQSDFIKLCLSVSPLVYGIFVQAIGGDIKKILVVSARLLAATLSAPLRCIPCIQNAFKNPQEMSKQTWLTLLTELTMRALPATPLFFLAYCTSFSGKANILASDTDLSPLQENLANIFMETRVIAFNASILLSLAQRHLINPLLQRIYGHLLRNDLTSSKILKSLGWESKSEGDKISVWPKERKKGSKKPTPPSYAEIQNMRKRNLCCQPIICKRKKAKDFLSLLSRTPGAMNRCVALQSILSFFATVFIKTMVFTFGMVVPLTEFGQESNDPEKQNFYPYLACVFIGMLCVKTAYKSIRWFNLGRPISTPGLLSPESSKKQELEMNLIATRRGTYQPPDAALNLL